MNQLAGIGHNSVPFMDELNAINETLAARIAADNKALSERKTFLLKEADELPKTIKNDEQSGQISDHVRKLKTLVADAEAMRTSIKRPVLTAGDIIDSLFKKFKTTLNDKMTELNKRGTIYDLAKEAKAREKLEAEAEARRQEEDRARREAEKAMKSKSVDKQIDATHDLSAARSARVAAENAAEVRPAEITRVEGESSSSRLIEIYHGEVEDFDKVDLNALRRYIPRRVVEDAAERAARDLEANGIGAIKGVRIYSEKQRKVS